MTNEKKTRSPVFYYERIFMKAFMGEIMKLKGGISIHLRNFFNTFLKIDMEKGVLTGLDPFIKQNYDSKIDDTVFIDNLTSEDRLPFFLLVPPVLWEFMFMTAIDFFDINYVGISPVKDDLKNKRRLFYKFVTIVEKKGNFTAENKVKYTIVDSSRTISVIDNSEYENAIMNGSGSLMRIIGNFVNKCIVENRVMNFFGSNISLSPEKIGELFNTIDPENIKVNKKRYSKLTLSSDYIINTFHGIKSTSTYLTDEDIKEGMWAFLRDKNKDESHKEDKELESHNDESRVIPVLQYFTEFEKPEVALMIMLLWMTKISYSHISRILDRYSTDHSVKGKSITLKRKINWYINNVLAPPKTTAVSAPPKKWGNDIRQVLNSLYKILASTAPGKSMKVTAFLTEVFYIYDTVKAKTTIAYHLSPNAKMGFNTVLSTPIQRILNRKTIDSLSTSGYLVESKSDNIFAP